MADPLKLFESRDIQAAALYAKRVASDTSDLFPVLVDSAGNLCVNLTIGTITVSSTASTITNAASNPVPVTGNVNISSATLGTVTVVSSSVTVSSISITASTTVTGTVTTNVLAGNINVSSATLGTVTVAGDVNISSATLGTVTVALSSTAVTVSNGAGVLNVNVATATLGTVVTSMSSTIVTAQISATSSVVTCHLSPSTTGVTVSNSVSTLMLISKTLTGSTGSVSATWTSIFTPSARAKIYAFSFTTTSASEVQVLLCDGVFANAKEKWRTVLMAPAGSSAGANLAVCPPGFLFSSRSTSAVTISLSTAVLVHYSLSYYDEA